MKKFLLALASTGALASTPAFAQTADATFTGPWVGAVLGYDISRAGSDYDDDLNNQNDQSIDGVLYGVGAGYDIDFGGAVVGVEGEVTDSTAKTGFTRNGDFEGFGLGRVDTGRDLYVGARAGIKARPDVLVYVKGGYTNARYNILASDGETELRDHIDTDGFRLGAGAEYAVNKNTFAKLEYRYSNYSKGEIDYPAETADSDRFNIDTDRHQVVASVGVRF